MRALGAGKDPRAGRLPGLCFIRLAVLVAAGLGCGKGTSEGTPLQLFTLFDVGPFLEATRAQAGTSADLLPTGFPASFYTRGPQGSATFSLNVSPAFVEGQVAAYVPAETWLGFDEVWMQPMYVLAAADPSGELAPIPGQPPVFSVRPQSAFYSSFWRTVFAVVPPGVAPERYRSVRAIFADGLQLSPGPGRLVVLSPPGVDITGYQRDPADVPPAHPLDPSVATATVPQLDGVVDGESGVATALDFGTDRFTWTPSLTVDEAPVFALRAVDATGQHVATRLPWVGGTGPLWSSTPPRTSHGGRPSFGSLWHLVYADLPAGAGAIVPDSVPNAADLRSHLADLGLFAQDTMPSAWSAQGDTAPFIERPVANPSDCFAAASPTDGTCQWIDSQVAVESYLAASIHSTDMLVTGPLVVYRGKAVP